MSSSVKFRQKYGFGQKSTDPFQRAVTAVFDSEQEMTFISAEATMTKKSKAISDNELLERLSAIEKNQLAANKQLMNKPTLYEVGFLKNFISGKFKGLSLKDFQEVKDQSLFTKFNAMSEKEREKAYKNLLKKLDSKTLK